MLITQPGDRRWADGDTEEAESEEDLNIVEDLANDSFDLELGADDEYDTDLEMDIDGKCCPSKSKLVVQLSHSSSNPHMYTSSPSHCQSIL